ncbi:MAG: malic enzyme-like NAD(P)-binding protein [Patescibacteria group bacterium]
MDINEQSIELHRKSKGKLATALTVPLATREDLSLAYTPGVAAPCLEIAKNPEEVWNLTIKSHTVAVITDGSAVLGLGNIGAEASLPVMEGKCALFKRFAGLDAFPIAIKSQDVDEIVETVVRIAPIFGGINLEDISAPRCFEVEERLNALLDIPVMHDDQHGTATVIVAGLINALKVVNKKAEDIKVVFSGAGAAGLASAKLLVRLGVKDIVMVDSNGVISSARTDLNDFKKSMVQMNIRDVQGTLADAVNGADAFVGLSAPRLLSVEMVKTMAPSAIVFAMANPTPEIMPGEAKAAGAAVVASGRSDFPNQINNVLAFPGIFKGALRIRARKITEEMQLKAARAIASLVSDPTAEKIVPSPFDAGVADAVADAVASINDV